MFRWGKNSKFLYFKDQNLKQERKKKKKKANYQHVAKAGKHLDLPSLCLFQFPRWVDPNPKSETTKTTSQNHLHHSTQNKRRILPNKLDNNLCKSSGDHGTFIEE